MKKNLGKNTVILGIAIPVFILSGVLFYINNDKAGESLHPDIARPGNDVTLEKFNLAPESLENIADTATVYSNDVDIERSIRNASSCIGLDIGSVNYTEMPGDVNTRKYKLPDGVMYLTETTGYWNYKSDSSSSADGVVADKFISDDKIKEKTDEFIKSNKLLDGESYNISIGSSTTGGWNSPEMIISKDAYVFPNINDIEVYGVYRMIISYDSEGNITEIFSCCNPVSKVVDVKLKPDNAVKTALDTGNYSAGASLSMKSVDIRSVRMAYYADSSPNDKGNLYIYPVYILTAEGTSASNDKEEFDIIVDAVA